MTKARTSTSQTDHERQTIEAILSITFVIVLYLKGYRQDSQSVGHQRLKLFRSIVSTFPIVMK